MAGFDSTIIVRGDNEHRLQEWDITTLPAQSDMEDGRVFASISNSGANLVVYSDFDRSNAIASASSMSVAADARVTLTAVGGSAIAGTFYYHPQAKTDADATIELYLIPAEDSDLTDEERGLTQLYKSGESSFSSFLRDVQTRLVEHLRKHHFATLFIETENGFFDLTKLHNPRSYHRGAVWLALSKIYRHHNNVAGQGLEDPYLARSIEYEDRALREWNGISPRVDTGGDQKSDGRTIQSLEILPG